MQKDCCDCCGIMFQSYSDIFIVCKQCKDLCGMDQENCLFLMLENLTLKHDKNVQFNEEVQVVLFEASEKEQVETNSMEICA